MLKAAGPYIGFDPPRDLDRIVDLDAEVPQGANGAHPAERQYREMGQDRNTTMKVSVALRASATAA